MPIHPATMEFLRFLRGNPIVRSQIRASPNNTLLYAGGRPNSFATQLLAALPPSKHPAGTQVRDGEVITGVWNRLETPLLRDPYLREKQTLPQVLKDISVPGTAHANLLDYAIQVHAQVPEKDRSILWRALSGIFASNAIGAVSFELGGGVTRAKVLASTEIPVLLRNPKIDSNTREMLAYYQRCIATGDPCLVSLEHG